MTTAVGLAATGSARRSFVVLLLTVQFLFASFDTAAAAEGGDAAECPAGVSLVPNAVCSGPRDIDELEAMMQANGYTASRRPPCTTDGGNSTGPTIVQVQLRLTQLNSVDPKQSLIKINGYFRSYWKDPRLAYSGDCVDAISVPGSRKLNIWMPDIFVDNLVEQVKEGMGSLTQISPDGSVWRSEQVLWSLKTAFNFGKLPYDTHTAKVDIASYSQDISQMRVIPRGGIVGPGLSGVGVSAAPQTNDVWGFEENPEGGFETMGLVTVNWNWDYVSFRWKFHRKPRFFETQVIIPTTLFLAVSYIQFWVDPGAAPARAALAVIPVLIMRTMSNSIYKSIPEGSQSMWLDDFVSTGMWLCCIAAMHFGVVQFYQLVEKGRAEKLVGLVKSKEIAERLGSQAKEKGIPLLVLVLRCAPSLADIDHDSFQKMDATARAEHMAVVSAAGQAQDDDFRTGQDAAGQGGVALASVAVNVTGIDPGSPTAQPKHKKGDSRKIRKMWVRSQEAIDNNVTEADLLFITYAVDIFRKCDKDNSNHANSREIQDCLRFFNIYMSKGQVKRSLGRFLRDHGAATPDDENELTVTFSEFVRLMMQVNRYTLKREINIFSHFKDYMRSVPMSQCWDVIARGIFPILIVFKFVYFYSVLDVLYKGDDMVV